MRRPVFSFVAFLAGAALMALAAAPDAVAFQKGKKKANDGVVTDWGKPKAFEPGKPAHYWIWYEDGTWKFRTTTAKKHHQFVGRIEAEGGSFSEIVGWNGEKLGKDSDVYKFNADRTAVVFEFRTDGRVDGLNFKPDETVKSIKFTLAIDGERHPKHIALGKAGDHPKEAVFTVPAHPEAKK